jgi:transcription factor S
MFCPKCQAILLPIKEGRATKLQCGCGYVHKKREEIVMREKVEISKQDQIEIIDKRVNTLPKTKEECPKCYHPEAFFWLVQTRASDEAETRFFKCVKCEHTWRAY